MYVKLTATEQENLCYRARKPLLQSKKTFATEHVWPRDLDYQRALRAKRPMTSVPDLNVMGKSGLFGYQMPSPFG